MQLFNFVARSWCKGAALHCIDGLLYLHPLCQQSKTTKLSGKICHANETSQITAFLTRLHYMYRSVSPLWPIAVRVSFRTHNAIMPKLGFLCLLLIIEWGHYDQVPICLKFFLMLGGWAISMYNVHRESGEHKNIGIRRENTNNPITTIQLEYEFSCSLHNLFKLLW